MLKDNWLERQMATVKELIEEGGQMTKENRFSEAEKRLQEAEIILDSAEDISDDVLHMRTVVFNDLGIIASRTNAPPRALHYYRKCVQAAEALAARGEKKVYLERITTLVNMGVLCAATQNPSEGIQVSERALELLEESQDDGNHASLMGLMARYHLGLNQHLAGLKDEAADNMKKAADVVVHQMEKGEGVQPILAELLSNAARVQADKGDFENAAVYARKGADLALAMFEAQQNQAFLRQFVAMEMDLVTFHERCGRFAQAEDSLFKVLDLLPDDPNVVKRGEAFYQKLLGLSDEELEAGDLPREEVQESLEDLRKRAMV